VRTTVRLSSQIEFLAAIGATEDDTTGSTIPG
jgi:hypothetical protein